MKHFNLFLFVCTFVVTTTSYAQKRKVFETLPEYLTYVQQTGIDTKRLIVFNKEDYYAIGNDLVNNKLYVFYGIVHDSQVIQAAQLELPGCWGQFRELCKSVTKESTGVPTETISYLKNIPFKKDKKTIIFIYSCNSRKLWKRSIKPVLDAVANDPDFDYILLSADTMNIKSLRAG